MFNNAQGGLLRRACCRTRRRSTSPGPTCATAGQQPVRARCGPSAGASPSSCSIPAQRAGGLPGVAVALPGAHRHRDRVPRHHAGGVRDAVRGRRGPALRSRSTARRSGQPAAAEPAAAEPAGAEPAGAEPRRLTRPAPGWAAPRGTVGLPAFLAETCLSYCEFYELWQSGFVAFRNGATRQARQEDGAFPECEPCCPDDLWLQFPEETAAAGPGRAAGLRPALAQAAGVAAAAATPSRSCATSATCCSCRRAARSTRTSSGSSPRSRCCATSSGWTWPTRPPRSPPAAVDADRTQLLALWVGPAAAAVAVGGAAADRRGWNSTRSGATAASRRSRSSSSC